MSGAWSAVVKAALLGTERTGRPAPPPAPGQAGGLVGMLLGDATRSAEANLLAAGAVLATARRAGRQAEHAAAEARPPAPPIDRPEAGAAAARTLAALLSGSWPRLLPEWLEACAATGRRVPSVLLPAALEVATADRALRPAVIDALGERGRWLAEQRPDWAWAGGAAAGGVPDRPAPAWLEGTAAERRDLLVAVRAAEPALGRELVESTWGTDAAADRAAFVERLAVGLSMGDEPFLEDRARLDRSREVRRAAAARLACLPRSRLAARMQHRAEAHLDRRRAPWAVRLPEGVPDDWRDDGIDPARRGGGDRAGWLAQLVAAAPLDGWGTPPEAVRAVAGADEGDALLRGWAQAAVRQLRADWATALLAVHAPEEAALLRVLAPADRAAWLVDALEPMTPAAAGRLLPLTAEVPRPWPWALVQVAAGRAAALVVTHPHQAQLARPVLVHAAERADPACLASFSAQLGEAMRADRRLEAELRRPLAAAQLRMDLLAELAPPRPPPRPGGAQV